MRIEKAHPVSPAERARREYNRLRYGAATKESIRQVQKRLRTPTRVPEVPPLWRIGRNNWARARGPVYLPELEALELLEQRRAARLASPPPPPAPPRAPQPALDAGVDTDVAPLLPRGLLGW